MHTIDLEKVKQIVSAVRAKHPIDTVAYVGCGASKADLYPGKYFLEHNAKKLRVSHFTSNEFNTDPPVWLGEGSLVITASLGGATPETVQANRIAKDAGAQVISLTNTPDSALTEEADYVILHGFAENYAAKLEKMSYAMALAVELLEQQEGCSVYEDMQEGFAHIFDLAEQSAKEARKDAKEFALRYKDAPVIYMMSSAASAEVAYASSICLMMEMQWIHSGSFHAGEFFHGPFEIVDRDVPFVLFMNEGPTRSVDARALSFLHRFHALTTVVDAKDYGLGRAVPETVLSYFAPMVHTAVFRVYAEELSFLREHPLTKRRYMWKLEY